MLSLSLSITIALWTLIPFIKAQQFRGFVVSSLSSATHYGSPDSTMPSISRIRRQIDDEPYYHQITLQAHDIQPVTDAVTRCQAWWPKDGVVPEWTPCEDSSFEFQLLNWTAIGDFTLDVKHTYQDPSYVVSN